MTAVVAPPGPGTTSGAPVSGGGSVLGAVSRRLGSALITVGVSLVVLIGAWTLVLDLFDVSTFVGKGPSDVWHYLFSDAPALGIRPTTLSAGDARSELFGALGTTLIDAGIGFAAGLLFALLIAMLFVLFRPFEFAFLPIAMLLRSVPLVAIAPVILLIVGRGKGAIAVIGAVVVLFPALVNMVLGLRSAPPSALDVVKVNGGSTWTALVKVRLPAALPNIFAAVRISVIGAYVGAMLGEWLSGFEGLGGLLSSYKGVANFTGVWAIVAVSVIASVLLYLVATIVESAVLAAWGPEAGTR